MLHGKCLVYSGLSGIGDNLADYLQSGLPHEFHALPGSRAGNWLNSDQARLLLENSDGESLRCTRDVAMISILLGCGLR